MKAYIRGDISFSYAVEFPDESLTLPLEEVRKRMLGELIKGFDEDMLPVDGVEDGILYSDVERTISLYLDEEPY